MHTTDDWYGMYKNGWKGEIVQEAFSHPAKFSRGLIRNIYAHMGDMGWLVEGDTVVDPFGGVALGALDAIQMGVNWIGCELEGKFVELGNENILLWDGRYRGKLNKWGSAVLVQGDSRKLSEVLSQASACVSSPPYAETNNQGGDQATHPGMKWANGERTDRGKINRENFRGTDYGSTPGQIGAMKAKAAVSSPPFAAQSGGTNVTAAEGPLASAALLARHAAGNAAASYGVEDGQMGRMKADGLGYQAAVSSPPYAETEVLDFTGKKAASEQSYSIKITGKDVGYNRQNAENLGNYKANDDEFRDAVSSPPYEGSLTDGGHLVFRPGMGDVDHNESRGKDEIYGTANGQIGNVRGDDFWAAARQIVEQTYAVLSPGAHAVWVVKSFVKGGKLVDFPDQWRQLCEACGFETLHEHRAWVVEDMGTQGSLFGEPVRKTVERKSFFRRLAESHGSPRIDWETVYCMTRI